MPDPDPFPFGGDSLRRAALDRMPSRHDIDGMILDTDIDGLLSGALLHRLFGWPVVGFYDTVTLWLQEDSPVPVDLDRHLWVDVDMTWPKARCLSQHVMADVPGNLAMLPNIDSTVNPSVLAGVTQRSYEDKYPFGTYQWLWWVLADDVRAAGLDPRLDRQRGQGLAWMPDGGYSSIYKYHRNCREWALDRMPGSLMGSTRLGAEWCLPIRRVRRTKDWLAEDGPEGAREWQGSKPRWAGDKGVPRCLAEGDYALQWSLRRNRPLDITGGQFILDKVTDFYGWPRLELPSRLTAWAGQIRQGRGVRPKQTSEGLLSFDGRTPAASAAAHRRDGFKWTTPDGPRNPGGGNLLDALGAPPKGAA